MKNEIQKEFNTKLQRILQLMEKEAYDAVVIGTQTNFSWLTCGGSSRVLLTSDIAAAYLVIEKDARYVVAYTMDGPRHLDEELEGMGFEPIFLRWFENSMEDAVLGLLKGKNILSDIPLGGADVSMKQFYGLHYPLTEWDIDRYRSIDQDAEKIVRKVVDQTKPGMLETEVEALLTSEFSKADYFPIVLLVGSDERLFKYRHPIPKPKKIDRYLMLILAMRKYGLNAVLTRSVYFGDQLPDEISDKYEAASIIAANSIAHSVPGTEFSSILKMQKELYTETGFPEEWKNHFQGGITGYVVNDSSLCLDPDAVMADKQTFNWFVTITGVNTEDTYLSQGSEGEILTTTGAWPLKPYEARNGKTVNLPEILLK
jgi:Xaa-Pro dipeptidase